MNNHQFRKCRSSNSLAKSPQIKFARKTNSHQVVLVDVVKRHIPKFASRNNNTSSTVCNRFDLCLEHRLFSSGEVQKLISRFDQHSAFRFRRSDVHRTSINHNLRVRFLSDVTFDSSFENHSLHYLRGLNPTTEDFADPDVVDIEIGFVREGGNASLRNECGEKIFPAVLFAHHRCSNAGFYLFNVTEVFDFVDDLRGQDFESFIESGFVAFYDFGCGDSL